MDDHLFFPRCGRGRHHRHHPHGHHGPHGPRGHPDHPHGPRGHPHHLHGPRGHPPHPHGPRGHPHHPHHRPPWFQPPHHRWPPHPQPPLTNPDLPIEPLQQPMPPQYQPPINLSPQNEAMQQLILQHGPPPPQYQPPINSSPQIEAAMQQLILQHGPPPPQEIPKPRAQPPEVRPQPERRGGFECDFVEEPPETFPQWECPICLFTVREPHQATCCGYSFCRGCIERVKRDNKPCPTCNEREFQTFHNKGLEKSLYGFKVHCTKKADGCRWTGELRELDNHLEQVHN